MKHKINIGKNVDTGEDVFIDLEKFISTRAVVAASSGAGKSWLVRRLLGESHGKVQQVILDWEGEYSNLRREFDYLLVGKSGEIPISIKTAEILAKKIMQLKVSTIIDLSDLPRHERIIFVKRFLEALLNLDKELYDHFVMLLIDEIHKMCPQKGECESKNAVNDAYSLGRKRGIGTVGCTQRVSKFDKDAFAEAGNQMLGRMNFLDDRKRAAEELGFNSKELEQSIKSLDDGEFYMTGSGISKEIIKVKVGDIKVRPPKIGEKGLKSETKTPKAIKEILKEVTDLTKEADQELKSKQEKDAEITRLRRENTVLLSKQKEPKIKEVKVVDHRALQVAQKEGWTLCEKQYSLVVKELKDTNQWLKLKNQSLSNKLQRIQVLTNEDNLKMPELTKHSIELPKFESKPMSILEIKPIPTTKPLVAELNLDSMPDVQNDEEIRLPPAYDRMLRAAAMFEPNNISYAKIAMLADVPLKSSTFRNGLSKLKSSGLLNYSNGVAKITDRGIEFLGSFERLPTDSESVIKMWMNRLAPAYGKMLKAALDSYPNPISKADMAANSGVPLETSTFRNGLSKLRTLSLISSTGDEIKAAEELFE